MSATSSSQESASLESAGATAVAADVQEQQQQQPEIAAVDVVPVVAVAAAVAAASAEPIAKTDEEKLLLAKYPTAGSGLRGNGPSGHSAFLQKRLQKGQKYFDSGDYQMAKQKGGGIKQVFANKVTTGDTIPTPESVPARKTSIIQPCNKFTTS